MEEQVNSNSPSRRERLATDAAMYMARALMRKGLKVVVDTPEKAREVYGRVASEGGPERFSVGDMMRLNYEWNGDEVSLRTFAQTFSDYIRQKDHTLEDAERIANAFLDAVEKDPASFVPKLKAENMSHARYFILNDGSVFGPEHPMYNSPEYETQRGLVQIYSEVLGDEDFSEYLRLLDPSRVRTPEEDERFVSMEREVSGSDIMQRSLEVNADKVNESRVKGIANLVQYFSNNPDYMSVEKALIVKGAMTWGVVEKKSGDANEVKIVRMTDSNDLSVPVIGGEAAAVAEGLRKGMNFKDALKSGREMLAMNTKRSVPGTFTGWKVYKQSDKEEDAAVLQQDAAGTGWCTGGALGTARSHLSGGDFHIYFEGGEPLIAIRTEDGRMAEPPRGAHEGQFCTDREEQIAFDYIKQGNGIEAGEDYVRDIEDIRRIMSPDATWRDAFMMPEERRYENGEFGGDTSAWGEAVEKRIDELMGGISEEERHKEGYYLNKEITKEDTERVKCVRDSLEIEDEEGYPNLQTVGGNLCIEENLRLDLPALQFVGGRFLIHKNSNLNAPALQTVVRCLCFGNNVHLEAPALQSVGEELVVAANVSFEAPALKSVGWYLTVEYNSHFEAPALQNISWDLSVCENASFNAPVLQTIRGRVVVGENASFNAPVLQSVGRGLDVRENAIFDASALQTVEGSVTVYKNAIQHIPALQSIGGFLEVCMNISLDAPVLQSVGGNLYIDSDASLETPVLASIGGALIVCKNGNLNAPVLQSVGKYLEVCENARLNVPVLQSIGGYLEVLENACFDVPALQFIGEYLTVYDNANLKALVLQSVGRGLYVRVNASLKVPALQTIEEDLYVHEKANLEIPTLQSVAHNLCLRDSVYLNAPSLQSVGGCLTINEYASLDAPVLQSVGIELEVCENASFVAPALQSAGGLLIVRENASLVAPVLQLKKTRLCIDKKAKHVDCPKLGIVQNSFQISDGTIYGYALNNEIHLTPEGINPETPIHEYSHLWLQAYRKQYPGKWKSLCEVVESHGLDACVRNDPSYRYLKDDRDAVVEESVCRIVGSKGGDMLCEMSFNAGSVDQVVGRFRRLLVTYAVGEVFGKKMPSGVKDVGINVLRGFADITLPKQTLNVIVDRGRAADKQKKSSVLKL